MVRTECPFCKNEVPVKSRFCNGCGTPLRPDPCIKCGAISGAEAQACIRCGNELPARMTDAYASLMRAVESSGESAGAAPAGTGTGEPPRDRPLLVPELEGLGGPAAASDEDREPSGYVVSFEPGQWVTIGVTHEADSLPSAAKPDSSIGHGERELANPSVPPPSASMTSLAVVQPAQTPPPAMALTSVALHVPPDRPRTPSPLRMPLFLGGVGVAAVAVALYVTLRQQSFVELSPSPAASREADGLDNINESRGGSKRDAGAIGDKPSVLIADPAASPTAGVAVQAAPGVPQRAGAGVVQSPPDVLRGEPSQVQMKSPVLDAVAAPPAAQRTIVAPSTPGANRAARALKPMPQAPATMADVFARPKATDTTPAGERKPAGIGPCTEAVAALGLCTPDTTQRRQ
jgi:hypothetical protein